MAGIVDPSVILLLAGLSDSPTDTERAIVLECLRSAESAVRNHLRYDPVLKSHTEFYPQMDFSPIPAEGVWEVSDTEAYLRRASSAVSDELQVIHIPIRSISSLKIDYDGRFGKRSGSFGDSSLKSEGTDYWANYDSLDSSGNGICRDGIIRSMGSWPSEPGSVKITYTAGYSNAELAGQDDAIDASPIAEAVKGETMRRVNQVYSRMKTSGAGFSGPFSGETLDKYSYTKDASVLMAMVGGKTDLLLETEFKLVEFVRMDLGVM